MSQTLLALLHSACAYVVVDATAVEGCHATLGRAGVVVLDESVVEALLLLVVSSGVIRKVVYAKAVPQAE